MTVADGAFHASQLVGPTGGVIAAAFGAGSVAGWHFAQRTVLKLTNQRFDDLERRSRDEQDECDRRISMLEERLHSVEERERSSMSAQLAQVRESSVRVLGASKLGRRNPRKV